MSHGGRDPHKRCPLGNWAPSKFHFNKGTCSNRAQRMQHLEAAPSFTAQPPGRMCLGSSYALMGHDSLAVPSAEVASSILTTPPIFLLPWTQFCEKCQNGGKRCDQEDCKRIRPCGGHEADAAGGQAVAHDETRKCEASIPIFPRQCRPIPSEKGRGKMAFKGPGIYRQRAAA